MQLLQLLRQRRRILLLTMEQVVRFAGSFTLQWHITHRCNLRCVHCYQTDYRSFVPWEELVRVLDQYEALLRAYRYKGQINFTGGEPMTHPDLFRLLKEARGRGMRTAVLTNGTLIGRAEARELRRCGVCFVQVSLDGGEKAHDAIRGEGSFALAVRGLRALRAEGIFTSVSFTAQRGNLRELPKLARVCRDLGVDKLWFDRVIIPAAEDDHRLSLTPEEFQALIRKAAKLRRRYPVKCVRSLQFLPCETDRTVYRCSAGERLLIVLADGSVMACRRLPISVGSVKTSDLLTIYRDSPQMQALRESGIPAGCSSCSYAAQCAGGAKCVTYARLGRWDLPDPDCPLAAMPPPSGAELSGGQFRI